ncbi:MAG: type II toxin-antitoxin system VapC family toxin [Thermoplasmata archaeon]|nr:type II toxin-antitoxin system VapC family toxin [Thermoplasmata archaeon]
MIFDASSVYKAIETGIIEKLANEKTLDLSLYELGNVVWKNVSRKNLSSEEGIELVNFLSEVLSLMDILTIGTKSDVLEMAIKNNLSYYDASYLYASISFTDTLVSEDKKLLGAASKCGIESYSIENI